MVVAFQMAQEGRQVGREIRQQHLSSLQAEEGERIYRQHCMQGT
jgi:hypothetical protein